VDGLEQSEVGAVLAGATNGARETPLALHRESVLGVATGAEHRSRVGFGPEARYLLVDAASLPDQCRIGDRRVADQVVDVDDVQGDATLVVDPVRTVRRGAVHDVAP